LKIDAITRKWMRNPSDEAAARAGYRFDLGRAQHAVDWIQGTCTLYEGESAGQPLELRDWQLECVMRLFGWVRHSEEWGREIRRFRRGSVWIAKKNKKSPTLAAIGAYLLMGDGEQGQKVFVAARDRDQAMISQKHAIQMVKRSPALTKSCKVNMVTGKITHMESESEMVPLPGQSINSQEGLNGSVLVDEAHVVDGRLMSVLKFAGISRSEPLFMLFSTAGNNPDGFGKGEFTYAQDVEAGRVEDHQYFAMVFAAPQDLTPEMVDKDLIKFGKMANPAWGHTIKESEFVSSWHQAKRKLSDMLDFLMYRLNIWQRSSNPWIKLDDWAKCAAPGLDLAAFEGRECWIGMDLAKCNDMCALALLARGDDGKIMLAVKFYLPEAKVQEYSHLAPFREWVSAGQLIATPGNITDFSLIEQEAIELIERFKAHKLVFDSMHADAVAQRIEAATGVEMVDFQQSLTNYTAPCDDFERLITGGLLVHGDHPVMNWQIGHVQLYQIERRKRPVKPDNKKDDYRKIDGVAATLMALSEIKDPVEQGYTGFW
jgi:phage terminase large subunit-like protein